MLAYTFGLRHAVDADHISAIDNVTRKLMQEGQRPVGVGLFFSLGHSSIVVGLSIAIAIGAGAVKAHLPGLQQAGEVIGTSISAAFLFLVAGINLAVLVDIVRTFRSAGRQNACDGAAVDDMLRAARPDRPFVSSADQARGRQLEDVSDRRPLWVGFRHRDRGRLARHRGRRGRERPAGRSTF